MSNDEYFKSSLIPSSFPIFAILYPSLNVKQGCRIICIFKKKLRNVQQGCRIISIFLEETP